MGAENSSDGIGTNRKVALVRAGAAGIADAHHTVIRSYGPAARGEAGCGDSRMIHGVGQYHRRHKRATHVLRQLLGGGEA